MNLPFSDKAAQDNRRAARHDVDGFAAVAAFCHCGQIRSGGAGNFMAGDVGLQKRFAEGADIDDQRFVAATADEVGDECVLLAFGVHRAENCDCGHRRRPKLRERGGEFNSQKRGLPQRKETLAFSRQIGFILRDNGRKGTIFHAL